MKFPYMPVSFVFVLWNTVVEAEQ